MARVTIFNVIICPSIWDNIRRLKCTLFAIKTTDFDAYNFTNKVYDNRK